MQYVFRTLIISADVAPIAREIAATLSPAGAGMWTTGISADGIRPDTHYISSGMLGADFADLLPLETYAIGDDGQWQLIGSRPGKPEIVARVCTQRGLAVTAGQVAEMFASSDSTTQDPFTAMARLGLQIVQEAADGTD